MVLAVTAPRLVRDSEIDSITADTLQQKIWPLLAHGTFGPMPAKKQTDGTQRQFVYPANAEIRIIIEQVILAEYEKMVDASEPMSNGRTAAERLRVLEQLKNNRLMSEEEYNTKRKKILEEL